MNRVLAHSRLTVAATTPAQAKGASMSDKSLEEALKELAETVRGLMQQVNRNEERQSVLMALLQVLVQHSPDRAEIASRVQAVLATMQAMNVDSQLQKERSRREQEFLSEVLGRARS